MMDPRTSVVRTVDGLLPADFSTTFRSWGALMAHQHATNLEKPWLIYIDEHGQRSVWSYAVFIDTAQRLAQLLATHDVVRGSRVVIAGHNHPDTILAYMACWLLGACAVPLNMTEDPQRLRYILGACGASIALCRPEYAEQLGADLLERNYQTILVDTDDASASAFYAAVRAHAPYPFPDETVDQRWDECLMVYTSGTTGHPKAVVLIQQNLFADGEAIAAWHGITATQRMMCVLPVHHVNGTIVTHVTPFIAGASVVLHRKFSARRFFPSIVAEGVHIVSVVPTLLAMVLEAQAPADGVHEGGFRHIICGAGPLTCELADRFEQRYQIPIIHGYGLSETTCYSCFVPVHHTPQEHRHWMQDYGFPSIGASLPCNEMAIMRPDGSLAEAGERGEIVIRGASVMIGYDRNPEANATAFAGDWFHSGDEGFYVRDSSAEAFYFITGRLKELIIRGGVNLAPLEIDEVINRAPGVAAAICVGFEHTLYGEEVGALVVRNDTAVTEDDILAFCRSHLPFSKAPKVVVFADSLPVTSTGKYQRNRVKHLFAAWKDAQFRGE